MTIIVFIKKIKEENIFTGGQRRIQKVIEYLKEKGNTIIEINEIDKEYESRNYLLNNIVLIGKIKKYLKSDNIIILQDYAKRFDFFLFNCIIRLFYQNKIIVMTNAFYFSTANLKNKIIDYMISFMLLNFSHCIITSGNSAKKTTHNIAISRKKVFVSYPALRREFAELYEKSVGGNIECYDGLKLLFVGGLHPRKGLEYLIQALDKLKDFSIELYIVGGATNAKYEAKLQHMAGASALQERITFVGPVHDVQELITFYEDASIFVLPSIEDPSPISILEAMTAGLPVIATVVGGIPEFVEDQVNGLLVEPCNPEMLARAIGTLYHDRALLTLMREQSVRKVRKYLARTWDDVAYEYAEIFHTVLGEAQRG